MTVTTPTLEREPPAAQDEAQGTAVGAISPEAAREQSTGVSVRSRVAPLAVVAYAGLMPFLVGLPRGTGVPVLRPAETLQVIVTAVALASVLPRLTAGQIERPTLLRSERWLAAVAMAASIVPLLWLAARGEPVGADELLGSMPFVKYAALYALVRLTIRTRRDARLLALASLSAALIIGAIAVAQALGVRPIVEVLGRYFVSADADVVDGGRGTTTIGSSIATGAYLAISSAVALSYAFTTSKARWFLLAAALAVGALASGQAGSVLAIVIVSVTVARLYRRTGQLVRWGLPVAVLAVVGLWPIVAARLADIDRGSGLPESWLIRWNNVTELYLPSLVDGGWVLGVTPDAITAPPDVWRDVVYLESGYLWLLWVGGVPLLVAVLGFLGAALGDLAMAAGADRAGGGEALARAGQGAIVMILLLSVFDPHLTLRAEADLLFMLLAAGLTTARTIETPKTSSERWRTLLAGGPNAPALPSEARIRIGESTPSPNGGRRAPEPSPRRPVIETVVAITVTGTDSDADAGQPAARADIALCRRGAELHGVFASPVVAGDQAAAALLWRGIALCAGSLRLASLRSLVDPDLLGPGGGVRRRQLTWAARLAEELEIERAANSVGGDAGPRRQGPPPTRAGQPLPIRLEAGRRIPGWKRATDLVIGAVAVVVATPVGLVCAALVARSGPGPVLFRQVRVGAGGLPFQMFKFRTMHVGNDDRPNREQNRLEILGLAEGAKDTDDGRVTSVGRWLRRSSLDEVPQLINVARGEMSLVGPRPSLLWEVELFDPAARRRLVARPGLTGLWQTGGRGDVSMREMLELDLRYVDTMSPLVDARCLIGTASSVVGAEGAR